MNILKGFGIALSSLILFICLIAFGISYTVNQVALNPHTLANIVDDVNISQLTDELLNEQAQGNEIPEDLQAAIIDTISKMEGTIKEPLAIILEDILAYLKGKTTTLDMKPALSDSFMNTEFVTELLENIDLSKLASEFITEQNGAGDNLTDVFTDSIISTIDSLEPSIKTQIVNLSSPVFKYLLGETAGIDLKIELRKTLLSNDFLRDVINELDTTDIIRDIITEQIGKELPDNIDLTEKIDSLAATAESYFKQRLSAAAGDIADYVVGIKPDFSVTINIDTALPNLKAVVKEVYVEQLPSYLQNAPQPIIDHEFEIYYTDFRHSLPSSFSFDSSVLGSGLPTEIDTILDELQTSLTEARHSIDDASRELEDNLEPARYYIDIFNGVYIFIIVLGLLMIAGIILIHRNVKGASLNLGIVFLIYGAIIFTGVLIARGIVPGILAGQEDIPSSIQPVITVLLNDITLPLFVISLVCLVGGILLVGASIIYPKLRTPKPV
jgi:hypothetical protein